MKRRIDDTKKPRAVWTTTEDDALLKAVVEDQQNREGEGGGTEEEEDWDEIAKSVPGKTPVQCLKRYMALSKKDSAGTISASTPASESLSKKAPAAATTSVPAAPAASIGSSASNVRVETANTLAAQHDDYEGNDDGEEEEGPGGERNKRARRDGDASAPSWPQDEIDLLKKLVEQYKDTAPRWNEIAANFSNRSAIDCLAKWQTITNPPVIKGKGSWTAEEDAILLEKRRQYGRKWAKIAAHLPGRQGKQCRERFVNHLDPELKKGEWTDDEESILIAMHERHGNRWANISKQLPGRSDNDVKNHWYSTIQRKFQQHGKEKLIQAAVTQVNMMQSMGTMPSQQPAAQNQWQTTPYQQATSSHRPAPNLPYAHHPPPPPPHLHQTFPRSPSAGFPFPPHHPPHGAQGGPPEGSPPPFMFPPPPSHQHGGRMPPPHPYFHHPHYHHRPPSSRHGTSPATVRAGGDAAGSQGVHTKGTGASPKDSGESTTSGQYPTQSANSSTSREGDSKKRTAS